MEEQQELEAIQTDYGMMQGVLSEKDNQIVAFKGIRYATAERFAYPHRIDHVDGVYDATHFGACSFQERAFVPENEYPEKSDRYFYWNEFRRNETYEYSDDCLFLNIWTPLKSLRHETGKLPVVFFIHGGGFTGGCGHEKPFSGEEWCKRGVIVVTINYRVGPFGFMCLPQLKKERGYCGNYGLFDQLTALQWVYRNIDSFGGNPTAITLMGQSAGAISIQQMIGSPLTSGLYSSTISLSCGGATKIMNSGSLTAEEVYLFWQEMADELGNPSVEELRTMDPQIITKAFSILREKRKDAAAMLMPIRDGRFVIHSATEVLKNHLEHRMPSIMSTTKNDLAAPILRKMAKKWTKEENERDISSYRSYFTRDLPGDKRGSFHSSDLWYAFHTLDRCWRPFEQVDYDLADKMITYYSEFVKNQDPNREDLPHWHRATKNNYVMRFDVE